MKFDLTNPPEYRMQFEMRVFYLEAVIGAGRMTFAPGMRTVDDIMKIRALPNGRVNLLTINEMARTALQTAEQFANKNDEE
jgi:hypothetical protein